MAFDRTVRCLALSLAWGIAAVCARADYLHWTLNFDDPQTEDEVDLLPAANPGGNNYNVWLAVVDGERGIPKQILGETATLQATGVEGANGGGTPYWYAADVSSYTAASYMFIVEIGATLGEAEYVSHGYSYQELYNAGYIKTSIDPLGTVWNPATAGSWHTPEPSSALLMLVGAGVLALRRRKQ